MNSYTLEAKLKTISLTYPILAWSELDDKSALLLISAPDKIQILEKFSDHNLGSLLNRLGLMLQSNNIIKTSLEGDANIMSFNILEFDELNLSWGKLLEDIEYAIAHENIPQGYSKKLTSELQENVYRDIAASAITAIYGSMLYVLLSKASLLGVTELMFIGDMQDTERLSSIVAEHLPEHMNLMMLNL